MTKRQHKHLWKTDDYKKRVRLLADLLNSDGCTLVIDWYLPGCYEHDIGYETGHDPRGYPVTRATVDQRFRWYIQHHSLFDGWSPMAVWRWFGVRLGGYFVWDPEAQLKEYNRLKDLGYFPDHRWNNG